MSGSAIPPTIVDTHLHLDEPAFDHDRDEVIRAAKDARVERFINIGHVPERWESSRLLRERHQGVAIAIGLHPSHADEFTPALERELQRAVSATGPVAIRETGFDFSRPGPTPDDQARSFRAQAEIAISECLPLVIHQRDASEALPPFLDQYPGLVSIVLHSFDGTERLTDWAIERGCLIGIGGLATKPRSQQLRVRLQRVPADRLLLETDSPYLVPAGARGRRNEPANLVQIARQLAPLWNFSSEVLQQVTTVNATRVFELFDVWADQPWSSEVT